MKRNHVKNTWEKTLECFFVRNKIYNIYRYKIKINLESTEFVVKRGKNHINAYGKTKIDQLTVEMLNIEVLENLH